MSSKAIHINIEKRLCHIPWDLELAAFERYSIRGHIEQDLKIKSEKGEEDTVEPGQIFIVVLVSQLQDLLNREAKYHAENSNRLHYRPWFANRAHMREKIKNIRDNVDTYFTKKYEQKGEITSTKTHAP